MKHIEIKPGQVWTDGTHYTKVNHKHDHKWWSCDAWNITKPETYLAHFDDEHFRRPDMRCIRQPR